MDMIPVGGDMGNRLPPPADTDPNVPLTAEEKLYLDEIERIHARTTRGATSMPAKLREYLFVGGYGDAQSVARLKQRGITHVLNCASIRNHKEEGQNPYPPESGIVAYAQFHGEDREGYDILAHFEMAREFINAARAYGGRVLVHCAVGVNRSCTTCVAYVMAEEQMDLLAALNLLKERRGTVPSNKGFRLRLIKFAAARGLLKPPKQPPGGGGGGLFSSGKKGGQKGVKKS